MESKSNIDHGQDMLFFVVLVFGVVWAMVWAIGDVRRDGLRRVRTADVVRDGRR